ncbi:hypothetical protein J7382_11970 [Shimia sp. R11_0]|uniref:hypothetical protein n=1 Tax=Shimia sp. R11_0 TaxID=2821096 RepID=UPI001ADCF31A|nr:hypothetical protein [Shimia sp. R11_0]MBO9478253.1 hypothetical protein [Shimia sp. R11_0]
MFFSRPAKPPRHPEGVPDFPDADSTQSYEEWRAALSEEERSLLIEWQRKNNQFAKKSARVGVLNKVLTGFYILVALLCFGAVLSFLGFESGSGLCPPMYCYD